MLKNIFIQNAPDDTDPRWNDAHHMSYDNKGCYENIT